MDKTYNVTGGCKSPRKDYIYIYIYIHIWKLWYSKHVDLYLICNVVQPQSKSQKIYIEFDKLILRFFGKANVQG